MGGGERDTMDTLPSTIASKKTKYLRINLTREGTDFCIENFKPLKANNEKDARNRKTVHTYSLVEPML